MPKNKINGFWLFVQRKVKPGMIKRYGSNFSQAQLTNEADQMWKQLSKTEQRSWNDSAKNQRSCYDDDLERKFDHTGVSFAEKKRQDEAIKREITTMQEEIRSLVDRSKFTGALTDLTFNIVHFNIFVKTEEKVYIPSEMALLNYSIKGGMKHSIARIIHPLAIPTGYQLEAVSHSKSTHHIPPSGFKPVCQKYSEIVQQLEETASNGADILFTIPSEMETTTLCLDWLYSQTDSTNCFRVYDLYYLLTLLVKVKSTEIPEVSIIAKMNESTFDYTTKICCTFHERCYQQNEDFEMRFCSHHTICRWAYLMSDILCPLYDIPMIPNCHLSECGPRNYTINRNPTISNPGRSVTNYSPDKQPTSGAFSALRRPMTSSKFTSIKKEPDNNFPRLKQDPDQYMMCPDTEGTDIHFYDDTDDVDDSDLATAIQTDKMPSLKSEYSDDYPPLSSTFGSNRGYGMGRGRGFTGNNF